MNVAVGIGHSGESRLVTASEGGPASKRVIVGYGICIFLLSDIVMFSALFAGFAVLSKATADGPTAAMLFDQKNVALETTLLLFSSYACGLMSLSAGAGRTSGLWLGAASTFILGTGFLVLELREFWTLSTLGATPQVSAFLSAFFTLVGCHGIHVTVGLIWLVLILIQLAMWGFRPAGGASALMFCAVLARARHRLDYDFHCSVSDGSRAMNQARLDVAPGEQSSEPISAHDVSGGLFVYSIGLLLAAILTVASFWVANTSLLWAPGLPAGLAVLAIAQMGVHVVFFLHITTGRDSTNNILALAFGLLIVILVSAGSLVIMANLNGNMAAESLTMHMQKAP
jgi:cytochrome o ubiquinol oxidase subunit III